MKRPPFYGGRHDASTRVLRARPNGVAIGMILFDFHVNHMYFDEKYKKYLT